MTPCANAAAMEPPAKHTPQSFFDVFALNRNSNETPRRMRAININNTGRYRAGRMVAYAAGNAANSPAPPEHEPGFVAVPDRRRRGHHLIELLRFVGEQGEDPYPEHEPVEQHVHEHAERDDGEPDDGENGFHLGE